MGDMLRSLMDYCRPNPYARRTPMVLVNGLAEQAETWFRNHCYWRRHFDVHMPNLLVYDGSTLHRRIGEDQPISVDYLVEQLYRYLDDFVQTPPYHLVASSLGGKIAIEFAVRYPGLVSRLVLICPSGLGDVEHLPVVEGVRRNDFRSLVDSVFFDRRQVEPGLEGYYARQFANRRWRTGLLRTIRGTMDHCVRPRLSQVVHPTLLVSGENDQIVSPLHAAEAVRDLPQGHFLAIPKCGHAPQLEKPGLINRLVVHFLTHPRPSPRARLPQLLLAHPTLVL
ncbi:MAG TPA: alpha/beta hydrolase [Gemmataceae bacterium]|nr:alpha/beta hydrolase [Gemmataceae bacterium]